MDRLAIINNLPGALGDYCFGRIAGYFNRDFEVQRIDTLEAELPRVVADWARERRVAGAVIDGALESPLDDFEWIRGLERFIREYVETGLPLLGICFGHEVMASALGGVLERKGPDLTVEERVMAVPEEDGLFRGLGGRTRQVVSHSVQVVKAPAGFLVSARTPDCPVQAMRHGLKPVYGVQFHPEMDRGIKIPDPSWNPLSDIQLDGHDGPVVMKNFLKIVKEQQSVISEQQSVNSNQ